MKTSICLYFCVVVFFQQVRLKKNLAQQIRGVKLHGGFWLEKKHTSPFGNVRVACSQNSGCFEIPLILN